MAASFEWYQLGRSLRVHQIPQLASADRTQGRAFLHHDGGLEHSSTLLPGLISRADHLFFPIDYMSHDAVSTIKRLCHPWGSPITRCATFDGGRDRDRTCDPYQSRT
jgi:hypothetical protein